jgi:hypothetical protein
VEVEGGLLGVAFVTGEVEGGGERAHLSGEVEDGVTVGGEGGRVAVGFGVEVVWGTWRVRSWEGCEWYRL